jgi:putative transposase
MSHTYASNRVHIVFSTKGRQKILADDLQPQLWGYIKGIATNHGFEAVKVGGVSDHVHVLIVVPPAMAVAKAVQTIKGCSSKWINDTRAVGRDFAWQEGYGAFSVSASQTDGVVAYIENQAAHHAKRNYEEEFIELLRRHGIAYDPAHVLG